MEFTLAARRAVTLQDVPASMCSRAGCVMPPSGAGVDLRDPRPYPQQRPRSLRPGVLRAPPFGRPAQAFSLTERPDRRHGRRSLVEQALSTQPSPDARDPARVLAAIKAIRTARVGGEYWGAHSHVVDGVADVTWLKPQDPHQARTMLKQALEEGPASGLLVSAPRAPWAHRLCATLQRRGVRVTVGPIDPWTVIERTVRVCATGDDPAAFLALSAGIPVRCVEGGDVSGWGLTEDASPIAFRGGKTLVELAQAMLFAAVLYTDPFTGQRIVCEDAIGILADWRRAIDRCRGLASAVGVRRWKRRAVRQLIPTCGRPIVFCDTVRSALVVARRRHGAIASWESKAPAGLQAAAAGRGAPLWRIEDGFLRSRGLGGDLTPPCSIVLDRRGTHYAPHDPSELEILLGEAVFDPTLLERAERLTTAIAAHGLTKYNTGADVEIAAPAGRRVVLVAGQVEDDASVRLGGGGLDCLDLLRATRATEPDAFILFKPHPDVEAGHRRGALSDGDVLRYADGVTRGSALPALLARVDVVHTLTSLAGFEALLRRRPVVVHGQPFYAGWGLTHDLDPPPRRGRRLTLAELVAGALILYPLYRDPATGLPCPPEVLVSRLLESDEPERSLFTRLRRLQGWITNTARRRGGATTP